MNLSFYTQAKSGRQRCADRSAAAGSIMKFLGNRIAAPAAGRGRGRAE
jgi:hypothetical protein